MLKKYLIFSGLFLVLSGASIFFYNYLQQKTYQPIDSSGKELICGMNTLNQKNNININWIKPKAEKKIEIISDKSNCSADKNLCRIRIAPSMWISLQIVPRPITSRKKVKFLVKVSNKDLIPAEIDLVGLSLNMGYLRPALEKIDDLNYQLDFVLPFCEEEKMKWAAIVHYYEETDRMKTTRGARFYFESLK